MKKIALALALVGLKIYGATFKAASQSWKTF